MNKELEKCAGILRNFDKSKPFLKCHECGLWTNITETMRFLKERLNYYSCINCGTILSEEVVEK